MPILLLATLATDLGTVQLLLARGADVNVRGPGGLTPLAWAAFQGSRSIADELLRAGANVHCVDDMGRSALMYAAMMGHRPVVKDLVAASTDLNARDCTGRTALRFATMAGQSAMVSTLLSLGANGSLEPEAPISVANSHPSMKRRPRPGR